jgi:hypothetical protein
MKWLFVLLSMSLSAVCSRARGQADLIPQGAVQQVVQQDSLLHWNLLQTDTYAIQYPPDWTANTTGVGGTSFALFAPAGSPNAVFRQNLNLMIRDVSADTVTLEELTNVNVKTLEAAFTGFTVISSKRLRDAAGDYQEMVYEFRQQGYYLRQLQEFRIIRGKAYILTFTSRRSLYETYQEVVGRILGSFKLKQAG